MSNKRRAFSLMELTVAICVMAILMLAVAQWSTAGRRAETTIRERSVALEAAENVVQRIALVPESEWDAQPWSDWTLPEETQAALPGGVLSVSTEEETETSLRFEVVVTWDAATSGAPPLEASLTTWRFRAAEEEEPVEVETESDPNTEGGDNEEN